MFVLKGLLRAESQERVLLYLLVREQGYGAEIASFFDTSLGPIQKQLVRLEEDGVVVGRSVGKARVFELNLRYPFYAELKALLKKALEYYPPELVTKMVMERKRPRKSGKPIERAG